MVIYKAIIFLFLFSIYYYWQNFCLHKEVVQLQKHNSEHLTQSKELLHEQQQEIMQKLKKMKDWKTVYYFQDHLHALSVTIPSDVALISVDFDDDIVVVKGHTVALEYLLEFLHNLEQSKLFQAMNLIEVQPSLIVYKEKKLVNFTIQGKLIK
jgi:Tfp pilus assembly protein PilN